MCLRNEKVWAVKLKDNFSLELTQTSVLPHGCRLLLICLMLSLSPAQQNQKPTIPLAIPYA